MLLLLGLWLQQAPSGGGDFSPYAQWGSAGVLIAFLLWMLVDERKEHRRLRDKVLSDVLPALIANNEQLKDSAAATVMVHQLLSRPNVDPIAFAEWVRTMHRLEQRLDDTERPRRPGGT